MKHAIFINYTFICSQVCGITHVMYFGPNFVVTNYKRQSAIRPYCLSRFLCPRLRYRCFRSKKLIEADKAQQRVMLINRYVMSYFFLSDKTYSVIFCLCRYE